MQIAKTTLITILFSLLICMQNLGFANLSCRKVISSLISINKTLNPGEHQSKYKEHKEIGILADNESFKSLEDGAYVYLVNDEGRILYYPRYLLNKKTNTILATHQSLFNKLKQSKLSSNISAAGEFYIRASKVSEFNNKSGRFRGGEEHLQMALQVFDAHAVRIDNYTVKNYANALERNISHATEEKLTKEYERILRSKSLTKKYNTLIDQYKLLYNKFPLNLAGEIDELVIRDIILDLHKDDIYEALNIITNFIFFSNYSFKDHGGVIFTFLSLEQKGLLESVIKTNEKLISDSL